MLTPNAQRFLQALIELGPAYRAELARHLDLTRATATNIASLLATAGLVEEGDKGGKRSPLLLTPKSGVLSAILFSDNLCTVTIATADGRTLENLTISVGDDDATTRLARAVSTLRDMVHRHGLRTKDLVAIHLAVDTHMDRFTGEVHTSVASHKWQGTNPLNVFRNAFSCHVYGENAARLAGLADAHSRAGNERHNIFFAQVSWGVTSAHIINGRLQAGARGGAGELGHTVYSWEGPRCTCGNNGCLMQYISIPALLRDAEAATAERLDFSEFQARALAGDPTMLELVNKAGTILGRALVNIANLHDPDSIVVGGDVAALPGFLEQASRVVTTRSLPLIAHHVEVKRSHISTTQHATLVNQAGIESLRVQPEVIAAVTQR